VSKISNLIKQRLADAQISEILVKQAKERILSRGKDIGGYAALWADTARMNIGTEKKPKFIEHYRKGGVPLYDTGQLFISLHSKTNKTESGIQMILKGSDIAMLHQKGFKTNGQVSIPFKDKGKHSLILKNGATIPARPIFALPSSAIKEIAQTIADAIGNN